MKSYEEFKNQITARATQLHIIRLEKKPNAELFAINPNRVMMISKLKSNVQLALFYN